MKDDSMDAVYELRERVSSDLENFIQLMPILIMDNDEDQKMLDYAVDMVKSIKDDLDNAKNVDDVSHTLNMRKLTRDYVSGKLPKMKDANSFIENITDDTEIRNIIKEVISSNEESVTDYKNGHDRAIKFLMGQVMKMTKGKANPKMAMDILIEELQ